MSKAFKSIRRGLKQAIAHQKSGRLIVIKIHGPPAVDVRAVRGHTGLRVRTIHHAVS